MKKLVILWIKLAVSIALTIALVVSTISYNKKLDEFHNNTSLVSHEGK